MKYFTIAELTASATAIKHNIDNTPTPEAIKNLTQLVEKVLDPVREQFGAPIIVTSGYRSPQLNQKVGGAKKSYHMQGRAVDLITGTKAGNHRLYQLLKAHPHTVLINEQSATWIHLSL